MTTPGDTANDEFRVALEDMTRSIGNAREALQSVTKTSIDIKDGISLISLKHHLLLSYMQSLALLTAHRLLGHSLKSRSRPSEPFTAQQRSVRGAEPGDLVDTLVEDRVILEKAKQLESKMRYQIEKLARIASEDQGKVMDVVNDPLAFRPNPENLVQDVQSESEEEDNGNDNTVEKGIYRPPKLAPMPYTEGKAQSKRRVPVPSGLATLVHGGHNPHVESTSGLGATPSLASSRAKELARMTQFEEENMTRLVMTKKEARRRARDEEAVALGGTGFSSGRRRGDGLEDEFGDIIREVHRGKGNSGVDDGYQGLRIKGRKQDALSRSRTRPREDNDESGRPKKKGRFQNAVKLMKRKRGRS